MRNVPGFGRIGSWPDSWPPRLIVAACAALVFGSPAVAQTPEPRPAWIEELVSAVVRIKTQINPEGRTVEELGRQREGSGIVIDSNGLVLTIGYLMVEAFAAEVIDNNGRALPANVVGYDHESGFGLLRTIEPLKLKPLAMGKSADVKQGDPVLIASFGGVDMVAPAYVVARREFAGSWEYLLDDALFTAPPHPAWSGAALISREGKLVGVGSLIVGDATGGDRKIARQHVRSHRPAATDPGGAAFRWARLRAGAAMARGQRRGAAWALVRQPRHAGQPGRKCRHPARRPDPRRQWRAAQEPWPTSTARSGRRVPPGSLSRSMCCRGARCAGSRSSR